VLQASKHQPQATESLLLYHVKRMLRDPTGEEIPPPSGFFEAITHDQDSSSVDSLRRNILTCTEEQAILSACSTLLNKPTAHHAEVTVEEASVDVIEEGIVAEFLHLLCRDGVMNVSLQGILEERMETISKIQDLSTMNICSQ